MILFGAFVVERGGGIHIEAEQYIPHYMSHRPILEKIYDFNKVEIIPIFRPRPLSYLIDDLDVNFIGWCAAKGYAHFESASYFIFLAMSSLLLWVIFRRFFRLDRFNSALLIGLISTSPVIFLNTHYFRSAKPGAVFMMLCAFVVLGRGFQSELRRNARFYSPVPMLMGFLALSAACLFDEIPPAFCLAAIAMLAMETYLSRERPYRRAITFGLIPTASALLAFLIYDVWIHKWLVARFTGQVAPLDFQASFVTALRSHTLNAVVGSVSVFTEGFGYVVGSLSSAVAAALFVYLTLHWNRTSGRNAAIRTLAGAFLMFGVLFGMISQEHFILHFEPRRMLYLYPLSFVFILFLGLSAAKLLESNAISRGALHAVLLVLIASNLTSLPTHWKILNGDGKRADYSRAMVLALRSPEGITDRMLTDPELKDYYPAVTRSEIYKTLVHLRASSPALTTRE